jgi:hypothetical protein
MRIKAELYSLYDNNYKQNVNSPINTSILAKIIIVNLEVEICILAS